MNYHNKEKKEWCDDNLQNKDYALVVGQEIGNNISISIDIESSITKYIVKNGLKNLYIFVYIIEVGKNIIEIKYLETAIYIDYLLFLSTILRRQSKELFNILINFKNDKKIKNEV